MLTVMDKAFSSLTVYFEEPFWTGVFERVSEGKLSVCKAVFGAEPTDREIWEFILKRYDGLKFSVPAPTETRQAADNPKRRQRNAKKLLQRAGIGTKSQQALQAQREAMKAERKRVTKEERDAEKERQFELKRQKRKEKRKGR